MAIEEKAAFQKRRLQFADEHVELWECLEALEQRVCGQRDRWQTEDQWRKLSAHLCDEHVELWECLGALERRVCEMDSEIKNFQDRRRKLAAAVDVLAEASTAKSAAEAEAAEEHKEPCGEHVK